MAKKKPGGPRGISPYNFNELPALRKVQYLRAYREKIEALHEALTDLQIEYALRPPELQALLPVDYLEAIEAKTSAALTEMWRNEAAAIREYKAEISAQNIAVWDIEKERERGRRRA